MVLRLLPLGWGSRYPAWPSGGIAHIIGADITGGKHSIKVARRGGLHLSSNKLGQESVAASGWLVARRFTEGVGNCTCFTLRGDPRSWGYRGAPAWQGWRPQAQQAWDSPRRPANLQQQCWPAWHRAPWGSTCAPVAWEPLCATLRARIVCLILRRSLAPDASGSDAIDAHMGSTILH